MILPPPSSVCVQWSFGMCPALILYIIVRGGCFSPMKPFAATAALENLLLKPTCISVFDSCCSCLISLSSSMVRQRGFSTNTGFLALRHFITDSACVSCLVATTTAWVSSSIRSSSIELTAFLNPSLSPVSEAVRPLLVQTAEKYALLSFFRGGNRKVWAKEPGPTMAIPILSLLTGVVECCSETDLVSSLCSSGYSISIPQKGSVFSEITSYASGALSRGNTCVVAFLGSIVPAAIPSSIASIFRPSVHLT